VLSGRSPATGRALVARRGPVCGYDLTFTAPKSASVLYALGPPEVADEVLSAHAGAVEVTMGYVAGRAMAVRRGSGDERSLEPVGGVVGAAFTHGVSRALDPHLHTHVVVANLGHGPDGRWTAVDGRGLFAHAQAAGHLYGAELRHRLSTRLGVGWTVRRSGSYEVAGIDPAVLGGFSARQAEIRSHLADRSPRRSYPGGGAASRDRARPGREASSVPSGLSVPGSLEGGGTNPTPAVSRRAARVAWAVTREPKGSRLDPEDLARRWSAQAAALGLAPDDLRAALGSPARPPPGKVGRRVGDPRARDEPGVGPTGGTGSVDEHRFAACLAFSPDACAARRDAVGAWAGALREGAPADDVEQCTDRLVSWGVAVGVAEPRQALAAVVPPPYQLRALGPRPASLRLLGVWLDAATAVARYRSRWGVTDRARPLGVEGSGSELAGMGSRQLADHLATSRRLSDARRELGRTLARDAEAPHLALGRG
jgi:conjugative relaxase-like TrwC/TraI family protein